jgi:hypothetical protein
MPTPFPHYVRIKDNYCCLYLGNAPEYVVILRLLKPQIEKQLPGLKLWIGCRDEFKYLLAGESQVVLLSELEKRKNEFSHIREIRNNASTHSLFDLMSQSELKIEPVIKSDPSDEMCLKACLICPEGIEPTKSMSEASVKICTTEVAKKGYTPIVIGSDMHKSLTCINLRPEGEEKLKYVKAAGWVMGVENEYLFLGAANGAKVTLVKSGVGTSLFKQLFPHADVA